MCVGVGREGGGFGQAVPDTSLLHCWLQDLPDHSHQACITAHTGIYSLALRNVTGGRVGIGWGVFSIFAKAV